MHRALAFAFVLTLTAVGVAGAQTVIVTHAPPGGTVELIFNSDRVQATTADAGGLATLTFAIPTTEAEADVRVSTERCGDTRRVLLVERGLQAPPVNGPCDRRDLADVFAVRHGTTFVIDVQEPVPSVHIRQGPAPPEWLGREGPTERTQLPAPPTGAMLFAGVGFTSSSDASTVACGTVTDCSSGDFKPVASVGVGYWITKNLGVQAAYFRPTNFTASGNGDDFHFSSSRKTELLTLTAMVGGPVAPGVRLYGRGGANYHRATLTTSETIDISGTQVLELKTAGWGWIAAGGVDVWFTPTIGVYTEGGVAKLKGNAVGGVEGSLNDQLIFGLVGLRIHIGR